MKTKTLPPNSKLGVPNLERALAIFELLKTRPEGCTLSEIAAEMKVPRNSVFRITNTLLANGYVAREEKTRRYTLSNKMLGMAYSSSSTGTLMENSMEVMRQLRDVVKETVIISVMSNGEGLVLEQMPGVHPFRFVCDPGLQQPVNASASPKVMLAFMPAGKRDEILKSAKLEKFTPQTITDKSKFIAHLEMVRGKGYALDVEEHIQGVNCVAGPILNRQGIAIAAVTVIGPSFRLPAAKLPDIARIVISYTEKISSRYGWEA